MKLDTSGVKLQSLKTMEITLLITLTLQVYALPATLISVFNHAYQT
jgi:hypothetical protein